MIPESMNKQQTVMMSHIVCRDNSAVIELELVHSVVCGVNLDNKAVR